MKNRKHILFLLPLLFATVCTPAQDVSGLELFNRKTLGLVMEVGMPVTPMSEGNYSAFILGGRYYMPLKKSASRWNFSLEIIPNICVASFSKSWYEFGINARVGVNYAVTDDSYLSFRLGTGPHWITAELNRQTTGFIFSDYFLFGIRKKITHREADYELEWYCGWRHLSNGGLFYPNGGINNYIMGGGISRILKK